MYSLNTHLAKRTLKYESRSGKDDKADREKQISTRLPAPEEEFQAGQPVVTRFLTEVMARSCLGDSVSGTGVSSFGECIILATICGRALSHRQKLAVEQITGDMFDGLWTRHQWLHELLSHRIQVLSTSTQVDSMLIFARLVAQTMVLYLHNVLESIVWKTGDHLLGIIEYERSCILAAHEVVNLVKLQGQLGYFKVSLSIFLLQIIHADDVGPSINAYPFDDVYGVLHGAWIPRLVV